MFSSASSINKDSIHAEVDCVKKIKRSHKLSPINIIIFRTNNKGDRLSMSKPCQHCINTIYSELKYKNYKLKKIWYTNELGNFIKY